MSWESPLLRDEHGLSIPGPHVPDTFREIVNDGPVAWFVWHRVGSDDGRIVYEREAIQ